MNKVSQENKNQLIVDNVILVMDGQLPPFSRFSLVLCCANIASWLVLVSFAKIRVST